MPLIVDSAKRDLTAVVEWGRQKMQEGEYEHAIQHFTTALEMKAGFVQALVSRGFCYLTLGDEEHAQRDFADVINRDAGFNRNVYVLMALCCKRSGDFQNAIRYLNRCISQFPNFKSALMARGELCLKVQEFERARSDFRQVLQDEPLHLVARRGMADSLRGLGNFREALRQYSRVIGDTWQALAHQQERQRRQEEDAAHSDSYREGDGRDTPHSYDSEQVAGGGEYEDGQDEGQSYPSGHSDSGNCRPSGSGPEDEMSGPGRPDELVEPEQLRNFLIELLMRRALLQRLVGSLEAAGSDLLEVIEMEPQEGLALFWYAKVLIETQRHQEALFHLQTSIKHHQPTALAAHALIGALLMTRPDPDFETAQRHLKEALPIGSQAAKVTLQICSAAVCLASNPRDSQGAVGLLDRALATLEAMDATRPSSAVAGGASGSRNAPGHVAGSGGAAAALLSARSRSAEEARWSATRQLVRHQQDLARGDDLEQALQCRTFLQLVAREPQQRAAEVPAMLFQLRVTALFDLCRWEEAVADCRKALILDPSDEPTQYVMHVAHGILRSRASKFEAAIGCFTKAIRLQPVSTEARLHRAIVLACAARAYTAGASQHNTARVAQLLTDAVQDLEAVQQQAMIEGSAAPLGAAHLRAACLCSLGRPEDAWEVLCDSGRHCVGRRASADGRDDPSVPRQRALEAEVLVLLQRHDEAIEACSAVLALNARGLTDARVMRGWCLSELGDVEGAFEDLSAALALSNERSDVHEAYGDLCMAHRHLQEAYAAYGQAARRSEPLDPRLAYKRALPQLALGQLSLAQQELVKALRISPHHASALRARDGVNALQTALKEDWRHAHVRFNMMLHQGGVSASQIPSISGADGLPVLFLPHELMMYRGMCSLYLGDLSTAMQDFATSLELVRQLATAAGDEVDWEARPQRWLPPEAVSQQGLASFECECIYNIALCHLRGRDFRTALVYVERLIHRQEDLALFGPSALSLAFFLSGICHLAMDSTGEGSHSEHFAKESFSRSYSYDAAYVDDFLRRHAQNRQEEQPADPPVPARAAKLRPIGGCPVPARAPLKEKDACDAAPEAVCCLRKLQPPSVAAVFSQDEGGLHGPADGKDLGSLSQDLPKEGEEPEAEQSLGGKDKDKAADEQGQYVEGPSAAASHKGQVGSTSGASVGHGSAGSSDGVRRLLSSLLPPLRIHVRDVVLWGRPSVSWPHVRAPEWTPPTSLARLDLLQQRDAMPVSGGRGGA